MITRSRPQVPVPRFAVSMNWVQLNGKFTSHPPVLRLVLGPNSSREVIMPDVTGAVALPTRTGRWRWRPAYSLDEAARIKRMMRQEPDQVECPHCAGSMSRIVGGDGTQTVWLVRCETCGRSLVVLDGGEATADGA